jgi:hypothetical protein
MARKLSHLAKNNNLLGATGERLVREESCASGFLVSARPIGWASLDLETVCHFSTDTRLNMLITLRLR